MSFSTFIRRLKYQPTELTTVYKDALTKSHRLTTKRPIKLRASSLPTCSLLFLEKMLLDDVETEEAMMDYYCSVGTTVHSHLQKWLGKSGKVYGNWICKSCGYKHQNTVKWKCPKCKSHMEYEELEVEYNVFSGHIDGLLKLKNGKFIVFDYKTTSSSNIYDKKYIPVPKHIIQVSAYAAILQKLYGMKIDSVSVVYVARDNPTLVAEYNTVFTDKMYKFTLDYLKKQIKGFKAAVKSYETGDFKYAVKYKLCSSYHEYKEETEKFMGMNGCHLSKVCFNELPMIQYFSSL